VGLWEKIRSFFRKEKKAAPRAVTMGIPAPQTLVAKVERLDDKDRDMLRVADEALRRGFPEEARQAYWKAIRLYVSQAQHLKAISVINSALKLKRDDHDAWIAKGESCLALDRRRDGALAFFEAANIFEARGDHANALDMLERCVDLDRDLEGLRIRYLRLGGTRDVWSAPPPPSLSPAPVASRSVSMSASLRSASIAQSSVRAPSIADRPRSIVRGAPEVPPPVSAPHLALEDEGGFAPLAQTSRDYSGPIDLNIMPDPPTSPPAEYVPPPQAVLPPSARPMVRFNIPQQSTVYEPGLPSAIVGTEHEAEASGDVSTAGLEEDIAAAEVEVGDVPVPDAQTQAMDISALSELIKKAKTG
jgi:hypothetical protein